MTIAGPSRFKKPKAGEFVLVTRQASKKEVLLGSFWLFLAVMVLAFALRSWMVSEQTFGELSLFWKVCGSLMALSPLVLGWDWWQKWSRHIPVRFNKNSGEAWFDRLKLGRIAELKGPFVRPGLTHSGKPRFELLVLSPSHGWVAIAAAKKQRSVEVLGQRLAKFTGLELNGSPPLGLPSRPDLAVGYPRPQFDLWVSSMMDRLEDFILGRKYAPEDGPESEPKPMPETLENAFGTNQPFSFLGTLKLDATREPSNRLNVVEVWVSGDGYHLVACALVPWGMRPPQADQLEIHTFLEQGQWFLSTQNPFLANLSLPAVFQPCFVKQSSLPELWQHHLGRVSKVKGGQPRLIANLEQVSELLTAHHHELVKHRANAEAWVTKSEIRHMAGDQISDAVVQTLYEETVRQTELRRRWGSFPTELMDRPQSAIDDQKSVSC